MRFLYSLLFTIIIGFTIYTDSFGQSEKYATLGIASYYHSWLDGKKTANGERYSETKMTAAHLNLPFNTKVKVTNLNNKKTIVVRINDRGPFINKRIIDLSRAAADSLGFITNGLTKVQLTVLSYGKPQSYLASANILKKSAFAKENAFEHISIIPFETAPPFEDETTLISENIKANHDTLTIAAVQIPVSTAEEVKAVEIVNPPVAADTIALAVVSSEQNQVKEEVKLPEILIPIVSQDSLIVEKPNTDAAISIIEEKTNTIAVILPKADTLAALTAITVKKENNTSLSFGVQIGSFKQKINASSLYAKMKPTYNEISIEEIKKENAVFYRLIIGKFADEKQAINLKEKLKSVFPASFIVHH